MVETLTEAQESGPQIAVVPEGVGKKRKRKRRGRPSSIRAMRGIRKAERQATSVFRDVPPNIVGLRRRPRIARGDQRLHQYGIVEDRRTNEEIMGEFLS